MALRKDIALALTGSQPPGWERGETVAVNANLRQSYAIVSQTNPQIYAKGFLVPQISEVEVAPVLGALK